MGNIHELETLIRLWKNGLFKQRHLDEGTIEELEDHLREHTNHLIKEGMSCQEAFLKATQLIGNVGELDMEEFQVKRRDHTLYTYLLGGILRIGIRHHRRNSFISTINFFGLTVAFTVVILISLFIFDELSYEKHHPEADQLYRLGYTFTGENGEKEDRAFSSGMWVNMLKERSSAVFDNFRFLTISYGYVYEPLSNRSFYEEGIYWSDPNFFTFLDFPLKYGKKEDQLNDLNSIVLTESSAQKIFGEENPVGKQLNYRRMDNEVLFTVTGIIYDPPSNSQFKPAFVAHIQSIQGIFGEQRRGWIDTNPQPGYVYTFLKIKEEDQVPQVLATMTEILKEILPEQSENIDPVVTSLPSIHFNPPTKWELDNPIDISYIYGLVIVAAFILIVALTNFASLTTIGAAKRQKEIGLRKTFGGTKRQLRFQFFLESTIVVLFSVFTSFFISSLLIPGFNQLVNKNIKLLAIITNEHYLLFSILIIIFVVLFAGFLPAFYFTRKSSSNVNVTQFFIKEKSNSKGRNILVVIQFGAAIILTISTVTIYRQLSLINNETLAKNRNSVIGVRTSRMGDSLQVQRYKQQIQSINGVVQSTLGEHLPKQSDFGRIDTRYKADLTGDHQWYWDKFEVDGGFIETYQLNLIAGRDFNSLIEYNALIVNEQVVKTLGLTPNEALGVILREDSINYVFNHSDGMIVGVIEDFAYRSLKEPIAPLVITANNYVEGVLSVRLNGSPSTILEAMEKSFTTIYPGRPFEHWFLDKEYERLYSQERRLGRLIPLFTGLAVFIALLGLLALSAFIAELRQKEIGIRKVLGCTPQGIISLLVKQNLKSIVISVVIAVPIAFFGMNKWLEGFAYRTDLNAWLLIISVAFILLFSISIISLQSLKVALQNPVKSIQYE